MSSHFSQSVLKTCDELNISFICLPPKTTHLLQPLDVAFYGPLKKYWRDVLTKWKKTEGLKHKTLVKSLFPKLLRELKNKLAENGTECTNLIAGFDKCGLYPINSERPKSRLPQRDSISEDQIESTTTSAVIDILQEMRSPTTTGQTTRKRKCNVPPGMSITEEDLIHNQTEKAKQQHKQTSISCTGKSVSPADFSRTTKTITRKKKHEGKDNNKIKPITKYNPGTPNDICIKFININLLRKQHTNASMPQTVTKLNKIRKDPQNWSFIAVNHDDLSECLLQTSVSPNVNNKTVSCPAKLTITSDIKITKREINRIRNNLKIEAKSTNIITPSALHMKILPKRQSVAIKDETTQKNQETDTYFNESVIVKKKKG